MTTPKNVIPQSFILSESFPNEEGIRSFFTQSNQNGFFTSLEEKNKDKVSSVEKTIEVTGNTLNVLSSQVVKNNKEYIAQLKKLEQDAILDHSTSTVLFAGVSNDFVNKLQSYQLCYQITRKDFDNELQFWLTPEYLQSKEAAQFYAELYAQFANLKDKLQTHFKITDPRDVKRVMPSGYGTNAVATTGIRKWQEIITKGTAFKEDHETRFVLTALAKNFRNRHNTLFSNMLLENSEGKKFGMDTLKSSDDAWSKFRITFG
jgi:thymidylate synthase ThyX